jgi:polyisoprenoid-binding protein YceI
MKYGENNQHNSLNISYLSPANGGIFYCSNKKGSIIVSFDVLTLIIVKLSLMATWALDANHSEVTFKVKHLVISSITGKFKSFEGTVESDKEDFTDARIQFSADVNSIDTGNEQRDGHLKSPDFFDAASHPKIHFESTGIVKKGSDFQVHGNLTIRGVTKPVELLADFGGVQKDFYGNTVAGFEINGKINRKEFGLHWSAVTETGGIVVGDDVKLSVNAEIVKKG